MNDDGYLVVATRSRMRMGYGADVIAVADGTVVKTLDEFNDNKPGDLLTEDDPIKTSEATTSCSTWQRPLRFYAHLKQVSEGRVGDKVRKGASLPCSATRKHAARISLSHHGQSIVLGSNGVPYVIESFEYDGQVPADLFERATEKFGGGRLAMPQRRKGQYPLAWDIINFP